MDCETLTVDVTKPIIDITLASVGGIVAVILGLVIGVLLTNFLSRSHIFDKFTKTLHDVEKNLYMNEKENSKIEDAVDENSFNEQSTEENSENSFKTPSFHQIYNKEVVEVDDCFVDLISEVLVENSIQQLAKQTLLTINNIFYDVWKYRYLCSLQIFQAISAELFKSKHINKKGYNSILFNSEQEFILDFDEKIENGLDSLHQNLILFLATDQKKSLEIDLPKASFVASHIKQYIDNYQNIKNILEENVRLKGEAVDVVVTYIKLIEEKIQQFQTFLLKEVLQSFNLKLKFITTYYQFAENFMIQIKLNKKAFSSKTNQNENSLENSNEEINCIKWTRFYKECMKGFKEEIISIETKSCCELTKKFHKLKEEAVKTYFSEKIKDQFDFNQSLQNFFEIISKLHQNFFIQKRSLNKQLITECLQNLKFIQNDFISEQNGTTQSNIIPNRSKTTENIRRKLQDDIKQGVKNEILINQLLEQDLNENNFNNLLLNSHELKLKKLMKDEINLFKSFIESQQYLSRRTADIILEEHHVIATIVYNNQSIISGSIQIVMNAYMTISQIQTVKETKIKTVFQMKKVLKKSRDHNEEKFQRLFGADYLWKATTEFRRNISIGRVSETILELYNDLESAKEQFCINFLKKELKERLKRSEMNESEQSKMKKKIRKLINGHWRAISVLRNNFQINLNQQIKVG